MKLSLKTLATSFNKRIGIDLGTSMVRIWSDQDGFVVEEPTYIAVDTATGKVIAVGKEAQEMVGRVPASVTVTQPVVQGLVTDPALAGALLKVLVQKIILSPYFFRPEIMLSVTGQVGEVEKKALTEMLYGLGAREVYFIHQVLAAAIGAGVPIADASGSVFLHLGEGVVEGAIISLGSIVASEWTAWGGRHIDEHIQRVIRKEHMLNIGLRTAEYLKVKLGSVLPSQNRQLTITGQDVLQTVPKEMMIDSQVVHAALTPASEKYVQLMKQLFEKIPAELSTDIIDKGMLLTGGLAQLQGLDLFLLSQLGIPVSVIDEPRSAVIRGIAQVLQNLEFFKESVAYRT